MFKLRGNGSVGKEFFHIIEKPAATINGETE